MPDIIIKRDEITIQKQTKTITSRHEEMMSWLVERDVRVNLWNCKEISFCVLRHVINVTIPIKLL